MGPLMLPLQTVKGKIEFPAFFPVTTFSDDFPLDYLIQPYLKRLGPAMMVSYYYAQKMTEQTIPMFIDSGGFASLFKDSQIQSLPNETHGILTPEGTMITPGEVLTSQEKHADIGATLDFIITAEMPEKEAKKRQELTIQNAKWALENKRNRNLRLFASLQAWDRCSMYRMLEALLPLPFDGYALGGMVPRIKAPEIIFELVETFARVEKERPLHIFGIGAPLLVKELFARGAASVDSSGYVRQAVSKRYLDPSTGKYVLLENIAEPLYDACKCSVCRQFSKNYLALEGELNTMALAIHNLIATIDYLQIGANHG